MKMFRSYSVDEATDLGHLLNIPQSFSSLKVQVLYICFEGLIFCYSSLVVSIRVSARILREFLSYTIRAAYPAYFILCIFLDGVLLPKYFVGHCIYSLHVRFSSCASCKTIETGDFLRCYSASRNDALASHFGADSARSISGAISKSVAMTNIRG
jgi:hypothetical protein